MITIVPVGRSDFLAAARAGRSGAGQHSKSAARTRGFAGQPAHWPQNHVCWCEGPVPWPQISCAGEKTRC